MSKKKTKYAVKCPYCEKPYIVESKHGEDKKLTIEEKVDYFCSLRLKAQDFVRSTKDG